MDFGFSEEQELLRATARKFLENECPSSTVRKLMDTPEGTTPEFWAKRAEQGWLGLIFPEAYGGVGLGVVDLVLLLEGMGRVGWRGPNLSPGPRWGLGVLDAGAQAPSM